MIYICCKPLRQVAVQVAIKTARRVAEWLKRYVEKCRSNRTQSILISKINQIDFQVMLVKYTSIEYMFRFCGMCSHDH